MILVFGAAGQLGQEFLRQAATLGQALTGVTRVEADIGDEAAVAAALDRFKPDLVVNAAAYAAVDAAETDRAAAWRANAAGPKILGAQTRARGLPIVHFSTDYVFDGRAREPYRETDPVGPQSVYGRSKLEGEQALAQANPSHLILRTAWLYGVFGRNFLKTILRLAQEKDELSIVNDQMGSPTATHSLARAILEIAPALSAAARNADPSPWGIYHLAGAGRTSWHGFATEIVGAAGVHTGRHPLVRPICSGDYPTPARRPANSALNGDKFADRFGIRLPNWRDDARQVVYELCSGDPRQSRILSDPIERDQRL